MSAAERASEASRAERANDQMDERVAQYSQLGFWLIWPTVQVKFTYTKSRSGVFLWVVWSQILTVGAASIYQRIDVTRSAFSVAFLWLSYVGLPPPPTPSSPLKSVGEIMPNPLPFPDTEPMRFPHQRKRTPPEKKDTGRLITCRIHSL